MSDIIDLACAREEEHRAIALSEQARRAGLAGKSAKPPARRLALPGVTACVDCQAELEYAGNRDGERKWTSR